ncbi:RNA 2',3'-cyclic phosphodiesterase [Nitrosomonas sp.]|uniref:RNA 2',3'-cyclic phosphodiesterase n=1 Tax=Nitrosomonas sp. TaxID=42353 RepID=UPI002616EA0F|nr:RNA 2',3'-cyclic phosphodiesterase [Nitrosomonas sp.]MCW5600888.1 RNA 2',3'-cyclic phosphodiesterase [Nitrosomonas sp.]
MIETPINQAASSKVFFALWPDAAARKKLSKLAGELATVCGGKPTRSDMIHLTLVFIGNVTQQHLQILREAADGVKQPSFDLTLDQIQYWPHNRIAHTGPKQSPAELLSLVADLHNRVTQAGFTLEQRRYLPHVTLVRKAMCTNVPDVTDSITWHVNEWALVESRQTRRGAEYTSLARWSLQPA